MNNQITVYVINLERSKDRRAFMSEQLSNLNIQFIFFDAVDGQKLTAKQLKMYSRFRSFFHVGRELSKNEIGCSLSHYEIYKEIVLKKIPYCLILEDDCTIHSDLFSVISEILNNKISFDLINFKTDAVYGEKTRISDKYSLCEITGHCNRTTAYLISYHCTKKIINKLLPVRFAEDGFLEFMRKKYHLRFFTIMPELVQLNEVKSTIWNESLEWEKLKKAPLMIQITNRVINKLKRLLS